MPIDAAATQPVQTNRVLLLAVLVVVVGVFATELPQVQGLAFIPVRNLLKNTLHASRESSAAFIFWAQLAWNFKPIVGVVQDAFPLFGTRRRSYMIVGCVLAAAAWLTLGITPPGYRSFLALCMAVNVALVVTSTAVGGYMVEIARASASAGRVTSVRNIVEQVIYVVQGFGSGYLASIAFGWTTLTSAACCFVLVPVAVWCLKETPAVARGHIQVLRAAGGKLGQIYRTPTLWAAACVSFLFYFAPGIQTAQFYAQQNDLHLTTLQQGTLVSIGGLCGVVSAALYGAFAAQRFALRHLLLACIVIGASSQAAYIFYNSYAIARVIDGYNGFGFTLTEVALMHLAVRATPVGCEALGFSIMISVRNFGIFGGDWLGAALQDHFHLSFHTLAAINGGTSLLALPVVLLLPAALVMVRDAQKT